MRLRTIGTAQVSGLCIGGNKPIVPAFEKLSHSMCENAVVISLKPFPCTQIWLWIIISNLWDPYEE